MSAKEILKLIEEVDPADTAKMDEIDARVATLHGWKTRLSSCKEFNIWVRPSDGLETLYPPSYTRSRDALKAIRPEGWTLTVIGDDGSGDGTRVKLTKWSLGHGYRVCERSCQAWLMGDKEELAELHAIIQVIEFERGQE